MVDVSASVYRKKLEAMAERMAKAKIAARFYTAPKWEERDFQNKRSLILDEIESAKIAMEACAYWYNIGRNDKDDVDITTKLKKHGLKA